jgi:hypothetical protein
MVCSASVLLWQKGEFEMEKKYRLTSETKAIENHVLHRIKALRDFGEVHAGELGGFVEHEDNLSHEGEAWIFDDACLYGNLRLHGDTILFGKLRLCGKGMLTNNLRLYGG